MSIKRYDVAGASGYAAERDEGGYVKYTDAQIAFDALRLIAVGRGYYGAQAREYKEIAAGALARLGETAQLPI